MRFWVSFISPHGGERNLKQGKIAPFNPAHHLRGKYIHIYTPWNGEDIFPHPVIISHKWIFIFFCPFQTSPKVSMCVCVSALLQLKLKKKPRNVQRCSFNSLNQSKHTKNRNMVSDPWILTSFLSRKMKCSHPQNVTKNWFSCRTGPVFTGGYFTSDPPGLAVCAHD